MSKEKHVLISGGGPVGVVTGLALARAGIRVTVFDRLPKPAEDHRAATLQPSTLDLFVKLGLTDEILRQGIESPVFQWRDRITNDINVVIMLVTVIITVNVNHTHLSLQHLQHSHESSCQMLNHHHTS